MSESLLCLIYVVLLICSFAFLFRCAIVYFKEGSYFLCGLGVALCVWEAVKIAILCFGLWS